MLDFTGLLADWEPVDDIAPDDLKPGDLVIGVDDPGGVEELVAVVGLESRFNPAFQPVRLAHDPHYARDFFTGYLFRCLRWRRHGERDMLGRDLTELAYLAGRRAA